MDFQLEQLTGPQNPLVAIVTGSSRGFGYVLVKQLLTRGYRVVASMRDPTGANQAARSSLEASGAFVVDIDVTRDRSVKSGVAAAVREFGHIDVLINSAGITLTGPIEATTTNDLIRVFDVNVLGAHRMVRSVVPHMRRTGSGLILQVSSGAGRFTMPGRGCYSASKWALEAISESLRWELATFGIGCVIVELGAMDTGFDIHSPEVSDTRRLRHYGPLLETLKKDPQRLASQMSPAIASEAMIALIEMPPVDRPIRLVRHPMAVELQKYNDQLWQLERSLLNRRGYLPLVDGATNPQEQEQGVST